MPSLLDRLRRLGIDPILLKGAGTFFLIYGVGIAISLLTQIVLARGLGAARYGDYAWTFRVLTLTMVGARLGLDAGALRFVAALSATTDHPRRAGYITWSVRATAVSSLVFGLGLVAAGRLASGFTPELRDCFTAAALALPLLVLLQLLTCILRGFKAVLPALVPSALLMPLLFALGAMIAAHHDRLTPASAMLLNAGAALVSLLVSRWSLARIAPPLPAVTKAVFEPRAWLRVSVPFMLINALGHVVARVDVILLGALASSAEVGHYAAAAQMTLVIPFALRAIESWAAPILAGHFARGERRELRAIERRAVVLNLAFTLPVCAVVIAAGRPLLSLFGPAFTDAYPVLVILAVGQLADALAGPVSMVLSMTDHQDALARVLTVHAVAAVVFGALCTSRWGAVGAAVAISAVRLSYRASLTWVARRAEAS